MGGPDSLHPQSPDNVCGNTVVYRREGAPPDAAGCLALQICLNPVGIRLGEAKPCGGCGASVTLEDTEAAIPNIPTVEPAESCYVHSDWQAAVAGQS